MKTIYDLFCAPDGILFKAAPFIPLLLLFIGYYVLLLRPQKKAQLEFENMLDAVGIGERLITRGGMIGVVVEILPRSFILEVYDGGKVEILKEAVVSILHEQ